MTRPWSGAALVRLREGLERLTADGTVPGGVIGYGTVGAAPGFLAAGVVAPECGGARPGSDTQYDLASLTKVLAVWPLIGRALAAGELTLDTRLRDLLPEVPAGAPGGRVTVGAILTHTSGLSPQTRLDRYRGRAEPLVRLICEEPLVARSGDEDGGGHRYVNRGFILLGLALAQLHGRRLDDLAAGLWADLRMTRTQYGPVARSAAVAPTERRLAGAPWLWGIPHDDNAALLGGVAGHAGVFGTAADLTTFAARILDRGGELEAWLEISRRPRVVIEPGYRRGLAWALTDDGVCLHHGFTGTSLYLAPATGRYLALCTNAVYHHRDNRAAVAPLWALALAEIADHRVDGGAP
ncbi:serine hydrolase domain-containing protein [Kitasatospora sp. NPDC096147]|uniref:serine hydrolase domain-containing protein n=1 Tax=Kitasatospora sp. NPDC096147 TaxID=3364093 RepID=UPI0038099A20